MGLGALGLLWDDGGDDAYEHSAEGPAQGYGSLGGLGILFDAAGSDAYTAPNAYAQGVSVTGPMSTDIDFGGNGGQVAGWVAGAGVLVDGGESGEDVFEARGGQGYGDGGFALLLDRGGHTQYRTLDAQELFQGGRAQGPDAPSTLFQSNFDPIDLPRIPSNAFGLAALIDLGGNDTYSNPFAPSGPRGNDAYWHDNGTAPLGIGIDSSLEDPDEDGSPSLVEVLAGSDPNDPEDTPVEALERAAGSLEAMLLADDDGDGFSNLVENATRSDPADPDSTPVSSSHLLEIRPPCPSTDGCSKTASLLTVGGSGRDTYHRPAVVLVDLNGDDTYLAEVAGPGNVTAPASVSSPYGASANASTSAGYGSLALDLGGDDVYDTPDLDRTQGSTYQGASLLLDTTGNDVYAAGSCSQGADCGLSPTSGLLIDLVGHDTYEGARASQAYATSGGLGAILDVFGADTYRYDTQATVRGDGGLALLFDTFGDDTYNATTIRVDPDNPDDADLFGPQGSASVEEGTAGVATGLFWDIIGIDTYTSRSTGVGYADVSKEKNGRFVTDRTIDPDAPSATYHAFVDELERAQFGDRDRDGVVNVLEASMGTDPDDEQDTPGSFFATWERLRTGGWNGTTESLVGAEGGAWIRSPDPGGNLLPLELPTDQPIVNELRLPGFVISGLGSTTHDENLPFLVDLGGNDAYTAPQLASGTPWADGATATTLGSGDVKVERGVSLLWDLGGGNDLYAPTPQRVAPTLEDAGTLRALSPSLGAGVVGTGILLDSGGKNTFRSILDAQLTVAAHGDANQAATTVALGASQGAGIFNGVGLLATWAAENRFETSVNASALDGSPASLAEAVGLTQGAGLAGGTGVLATFGNGSDTYRIATAATGEDAREIDLAQGAGAPWSLALVGLSSAPGNGLLYDAGGDNVFIARSGLAQGTSLGDGALGLLWSGPGSDTYLAGGQAQGSAGPGLAASTTPDGPPPSPGEEDRGALLTTLGILIDPGGHDRYRLEPGSVLGQGGADAGTGLLLDASGDDIYDAPAGELVQGAIGPGQPAVGLALDGGGHDTYTAGDRSQGFVEGTGSGILVDVSGWDTYTLDPGALGQGHGAGAIFVDAGGQDRYEPESIPSGNDETWQPAPGGVGIDDENVQAAMRTLYEEGSVDRPLDLGMSLSNDGSEPVPTGQPVNGTVYLIAEPTGQVPQDAIERVTFLVDNAAVGRGTLTQNGNNEPIYVYEWETRQATDTAAEQVFPDGEHRLVASAYLSTPRGATCEQLAIGEDRAGCHETPAGTDGRNVQSEPLDVTVDNPPLVSLAVTTPHDQGGLSPALDQEGSFDIHISRDAGCPSTAPATACDPENPGGDLTVLATHPGEPTHTRTVFLGYANATGTEPLRLPVNATACGELGCRAWLDGLYTIQIDLADEAGRNAKQNASLRVDGTPPRTSIELPEPWVGTEHMVGQSSLAIPWTTTDPGGSGIEHTVLFQETDDGWTVLTNTTGATTSFTTPTTDLQRFEILATSVDAFGNHETPCRAGEQPPCRGGAGSDVETTVDFSRPRLDGIHASPRITAPGNPVTFSANATDAASGIARVHLITDAISTVMRQPTGTRFEAQRTFAAPNEPVEQSYAFKIVAQDHADNQAVVTGTGVLDARDPRVTDTRVSFTDPRGVERTEGAPGSQARVDLGIEDVAIDEVSLDASPVSAGEITCQRPVGSFDDARWGCEFGIDQDVADGSYTLNLTVRDAAGHTNTSTNVTLPVNATPLGFEDLEVARIGHGSATLVWNTTRSGLPTKGTTEVHYGKTPSLSRTATSATNPSSAHALSLGDLLPSTRYFARAVSASPSGVVNQSELLTFETRSAIDLGLPTLEPNTLLQGVEHLPVDVRLRAGQGEVDISVSIQDAANRSSPSLIQQTRLRPGAHNLTIDTAQVPDGAYRLILEGSRLGDLTRLVSPVTHIDNTDAILVPLSPLPGGRVPSPGPQLEVLVLDPLSSTAPPLTGLNLSLDNQPLDADRYTASYQASLDATDHRTLEIQLPNDLAEGEHQVNLTLPDRAGNEGQAAWTFTVDTQGPTILGAPTLSYEQGTTARPGEVVHVTLNASDPANVERVEIKTITGKVRLAPTGPSSWTGRFLVPPSAADGLLGIDVHLRDTLGNERPVREGIQIPVDATPPTIESASSDPTGYTTARISVQASEPVTLEILGPPLDRRVKTDDPSRTPSVQVDGLRPNLVHDLDVRVIDVAGNTATQALDVRTRPDHEPPSAVADLQIRSPEEGVVELRWDEARDNAGVDTYLVERLAANESTTLRVPGTQTTFEDRSLPPGTNATYRVYARDIGDNPGPARHGQVRVLALPHLIDPRITPERGTTDEPFTFHVTYQHPTGLPAERVYVEVSGRAHALSPVDPSEDCTTGCAYTGKARLPASTFTDGGPTIRFAATTADHETEAAPSTTPRVASAASGGFALNLDDWGLPALVVLVGLAALAGAGILVKRRLAGRRSEP